MNDLDSSPDTSPGGGRPVTLAMVLDEVVATKLRVQHLDIKVDTAIRPVAFPRGPLWLMAIAMVGICAVGFIALAAGLTPLTPPQEPHAVTR